MNRYSQFLLVAAAVCALGRPALGQGYVLVVNEKNPVTQLSKADVAKMFLRQSRTWSAGGPVVAVDQDKSSPARAAFSTAIHGKATASVDSYWLEQVFAGKDEPPAKVKDDAAVIAFVAGNPGAVGYVSPAAATGPGIKKVTVSP